MHDPECVLASNKFPYKCSGTCQISSIIQILPIIQICNHMKSNTELPYLKEIDI